MGSAAEDWEDWTDEDGGEGGEAEAPKAGKKKPKGDKPTASGKKPKPAAAEGEKVPLTKEEKIARRKRREARLAREAAEAAATGKKKPKGDKPAAKPAAAKPAAKPAAKEGAAKPKASGSTDITAVKVDGLYLIKKTFNGVDQGFNKDHLKKIDGLAYDFKKGGHAFGADNKDAIRATLKERGYNLKVGKEDAAATPAAKPKAAKPAAKPAAKEGAASAPAVKKATLNNLALAIKKILSVAADLGVDLS